MYNKPRNDTGLSFVGHPGRCQYLALHFGQLLVGFFSVFLTGREGYFALVRIIRSSTRFYVCSFSLVIVFHCLVMCLSVFGSTVADPREIQKECSMCSRAVRGSRAGLSVFRRSSLGGQGGVYVAIAGGWRVWGRRSGVSGGSAGVRFWVRPDIGLIRPNGHWRPDCSAFSYLADTQRLQLQYNPPPHPHTHTHKKRHHHHSPRSGVFENEQNRKHPPVVAGFS